MKRIIAILTVLALIFAFAGCSSGTKNESSEKATAANTETASASETTAENKTSNSTATSNRKALLSSTSRARASNTTWA